MPNRRFALVSILGCCALAFAGTAQAKTVSVTSSSAGKTIRLHTGDTLKLSLREVQDGGFKWRPLSAPAKSVLKTVSSTYIRPKLAPGAVGGEGTRVNRYRAVGSGHAKIRLGDFGPSSQTKPAETFTVTVVVG